MSAMAHQKIKAGHCLLQVVEGDITALDVGAIVNAANSGLRPGGGVCGAIYRVAGPDLVPAAEDLAPCPAGDVRVTPGFDLKAAYVIHAVGPVWQGGEHGEDQLLADCYRRAIEAADELGLDSIAFPAISTGIYGFPPERAAPIAVRAASEAAAAASSIERVLFCCFTPQSAALHDEALAALLSERGAAD
jgi:O-acetyl-ADP-ribose deacetylase (regulator of RNase III)